MRYSIRGRHPHVRLHENLDSIGHSVNPVRIFDNGNIWRLHPGRLIKWSKTTLAIVISASFTILAMIAGIITVCLTTSKLGKNCQITVKEVLQNLIINNSRPFSVAVGHFNNDSSLDIVVTNSGTNKLGILLGYQNGSFAAQVIYSTGTMSRPISVAVGDFNNDHCLDIVVANYDSHTIGILLGHGNGTFASQIEFSTKSSRPLSIAVGHFNNDTWLDIVFANNGTNSINVLFGYGNGSFGNSTKYSTGYDSLPYSLAVGDFNSDTRLDIAVTNYGTNNVGIFLGRANGTFAVQKIFPTNLGSGPLAIAVDDFDNDDQLDFVVANYRADNIGVFLGYGNGTFATQRTYFLNDGSGPSSIAVGYINKDNRSDIVVTNNDNSDLMVFVGSGDGTFAAPTIHPINEGSSPVGLAIGDFNNDQQSDVVVANSGTNNILVLIGYTAISSIKPSTHVTGEGSVPNQIAIRDFNNDNCLDIAVVNYGTNNIGILLGHGNGSFEDQLTFDTGDRSRPTAFAFADFNNDTYLDIIVTNYNVGHLSLLLGYGNGTFAVIKSFSYKDSSSPTSIAVGDFNNDNQLDIVLNNFTYNSITILLGYGNETFEYLTMHSTGYGSRPAFVAVGDFNNDHNLDITTANYGIDDIGIFLGFGNGTFAAQRTYSTGDASIPQNLHLGDFNNDNCLDIAVANNGRDNVGILLGYCNGSFAPQNKYSTSTGSILNWVVVSDVNNDEYLDLVVANGGHSNVGVFLGYGNGTFAAQLTFSTGLYSSPGSVAVGDLNNDNRTDIVVANIGTDNIAILFGHPNEDTNSTDQFLLGKFYSDFKNQSYYSTGSSSRPYSIAVGDFNNDTYLDIAIANSGNENVGIILGYGDGNFTRETTYSIGSGSRPQHIITIDFDKNNQLDIVVVNALQDRINVLIGYDNGSFADKTPILTGPRSNPKSIASGDLNNDSWLDIIVANEGTDTIDIMYGFNYASFQNPIRFSTGDATAPFSVAVGDFNNDNRLDIVTANYVTSNVGVLLGYGNGSFTSPVMYANVKGSHPWSVAIGDFNNDNKSDITIANWGLNQIGVILGNGNGTFGEPRLYSTGIGSRSVGITVGDFNNDKRLDIATADFGSGTISVFLGYGNGTFDNVTNYSTGDRSGPSSIAVWDLNKDNHLDVIVANEVTFNVGVLFGNGDGTFANITTYPADPYSSPQYAAASDFNNDSLPDMAVAMYGTGNIGVFLGHGNRTFSSIKSYTSGFQSGAQYLAFNDLNSDNYVDIVIANLNTGDVGVLFGHGDGTFKTVVLYSTGSSTSMYSIAIADLNNDTSLDIIFTDDNAHQVGVLFHNGFKPFGGHTPLVYINGSNPSSVAIGDLNNDTCLDIVIANTGIDNIGVLIGHGDGTFEEVKIYSTGNDSKPLSVAIGDFNNDTLSDITVANSKTNTTGVFLGSRDGTFGNLTTYSTGIDSNPVSIAVGDFNNDNFLDIVVANPGTDTVGVFIGYGNGTFANQRSYPVGYDYRPNWVTFGDFNNDHLMDIAVVNYAADSIKILFNCPRV